MCHLTVKRTTSNLFTQIILITDTTFSVSGFLMIFRHAVPVCTTFLIRIYPSHQVFRQTGLYDL